ncbi:MAG: MFS transporter [Candidatus Midichloria sp.]|nr:MAG: MFS transporter [Candidatus Midichloria sp.]
MNKFVSAWSAWFFATMFYAYQYILRVLPNIGMPNIINDFSINITQVGLFSGIYYIGYTLMHIPIGLLIDRFSIKKVIPICVLLTSVGLLPLLYSSLFLNAILGRLLIGIASSASILGIFKVVKTGFGEVKFTSLVGMSVTIGLISAMYGGRPIDYLVSIYGWKTVINAFVIIGVAFSILLYCVLPQITEKGKKYHFSMREMWQDIKSIFCNPKIVVLSFIAGLMVGPLEGFADAWGTLFFESFYGFDRRHSSTLPSIIFLGMCFGSTLIGCIIDKTKSHIQVVLISNIMMILSFLLVFSGKCNLYVLYFLMFVIGLLSAYQIPIIGKVRDYTNNRLADITSAACNMIIMVFGTVFHTLIGIFTEQFGAISKGLAVIPVALIVALILLSILMINKFFIKNIAVSSSVS